jgi:hypothetical protein
MPCYKHAKKREPPPLQHDAPEDFLLAPSFFFAPPKRFSIFFISILHLTATFLAYQAISGLGSKNTLGKQLIIEFV